MGEISGHIPSITTEAQCRRSIQQYLGVNDMWCCDKSNCHICSLQVVELTQEQQKEQQRQEQKLQQRIQQLQQQQEQQQQELREAQREELLQQQLQHHQDQIFQLLHQEHQPQHQQQEQRQRLQQHQLLQEQQLLQKHRLQEEQLRQHHQQEKQPLLQLQQQRSIPIVNTMVANGQPITAVPVPPEKEWHFAMTPAFRTSMIYRIIPLALPANVIITNDDRVARLAIVWQKLEYAFYKKANSPVEYYHLLAEKAYQMVKGVEAKRKELLEYHHAARAAIRWYHAPERYQIISTLPENVAHPYVVPTAPIIHNSNPPNPLRLEHHHALQMFQGISAPPENVADPYVMPTAPIMHSSDRLIINPTVPDVSFASSDEESVDDSSDESILSENDLLDDEVMAVNHPPFSTYFGGKESDSLENSRNVIPEVPMTVFQRQPPGLPEQS